MQIYNYDPVTKEYLSEVGADIDPLETEQNGGQPVYLIPANATAIKPIATAVKKARVFNEEENKWTYVVDYRGTEVEANDGSNRKQTITDLGIKPEDIKFDPMPDEEQLKLALKDHILAMLDYILEPTEEKKTTLVTQYQELLSAD